MPNPNEKSPVEAPTSTEQIEHLPSNSDHQPTAEGSVLSKPRRPKIFHIEVNKEDPDTLHTLCGLSWPRHRTVHPTAMQGEQNKQFCLNCRQLTGLNNDLKATEQRVLKIKQTMDSLNRFMNGDDL